MEYFEEVENVRLYLGDNSEVYDYVGPYGESNHLTEVLDKKDICGRNINDALSVALDAANELNYLNDDTNVIVSLDKIAKDYESKYKNIIKDAEINIDGYRNNKGLNFSFSIVDDEYIVIQ